MAQDTVEGPAQTTLFLTSQFYVTLENGIEGMFTDVGGLVIEVDTTEIRFADNKGRVTLQNRPGLTKYGEITLKRQVSDDKKFFEWVKKIRDGKIERTGGSVTITDHALNIVGSWSFKNAWPSKWAVSDPDATSNDPMTEDITLQIEYLERTK
ncbi:MAG: phage tail protein [Ilumatobacteraceae bacterium]